MKDDFAAFMEMQRKHNETTIYTFIELRDRIASIEKKIAEAKADKDLGQFMKGFKK